MKPLDHLIRIAAFSLALTGCSKHGATPLAVASIMPNNGPDSTQVTVIGMGFSTTSSADIVSFNGKQASVLSATSTSLVVRTPTLAGTGNVTVSVNGKSMNAGVFTYDTTWKATTISDTIPGPCYLSTDGGGNVYVSALNGGMIYKVTPTGAISPFAAVPNPTGTAFDVSGNLYVISSLEYIYKVTPGGIPTSIATDFGDLFGIALDPNGNIYVANQFNSTVDMINSGGVKSVYDSNASFCSGLAIHNGQLYVVAATNGSGPTGSGIGTIFSMSGPEVTSPITSGFAYDGFAQLTFDSNNNLYVPVFNQETQVGNVLRVSPEGTTTTLQMPNIPFITGIVSVAPGQLYVTGLQSSPTILTGLLVKLTMH